MSYYICSRCTHKTKQKNDMKKHLNRIKKCIKNNDALFISDEDLEKTSLIKINKKILKSAPDCTQIKKFDIISAPDCTQTKKLDIISAPNCTQIIVDKFIDNIDNQSCGIECTLCNKIFTRNSSLKRHQKKNCVKTINSNNLNDKNNININNNNNTNNTNNNTINNILNINFNIDNKTNKIIPFDEDWDISNIDNETKQLLLMSSIKFTKTMEKILENDANLNILIEKEKNLGSVYKNDTENFKEMNINDIIDKSMTKLYKHLKQFYDEIKEDNEYKICSDYLDNEKTIIDNKYDEYQNNENTQKIVQNHLIDLYDKNKEKALNNYKNILENDSMVLDKIIGFQNIFLK